MAVSPSDEKEPSLIIAEVIKNSSECPMCYRDGEKFTFTMDKDNISMLEILDKIFPQVFYAGSAGTYETAIYSAGETVKVKISHPN